MQQQELKGVSYCKSKGKYISRITLDGIRKYLGAFNTKEEAKLKYDEYVIKFHKNYGML